MSTAEPTKRRIEDELLEHGAYATNTVGTSMRPLFKTHRDAVALLPPREPPKKYDVVLYTDSEGRYILHRIIKAKGDTFVIRGDNTFIREYVPRERVIAVMASFTRKGKHFTVRSRGYIFYSRVWNFIYPVRLLLHKLRRMLSKIKRISKNKKS